MPTHPARVLVTGDEPLFSRGLALLLDEAPDVASVYVDSLSNAEHLLAGTGGDALTWAGDYLDRPTLERLRDLRRAHSTIGLCLLASRVDACALERLMAHSSRRLAFILRPARLDADEFAWVIGSVLRGYATIDSALLRRLACDRCGPDGLHLSQSDREVMELVAAGLRNVEIGRRLWKSEKAIEKHVGRLFSKLGLPPESTAHLDRRVTATRIYLACQTGGSQELPDEHSFSASSQLALKEPRP